MALLKLSGIASKISGKLGGNIFGTGANGSYVKSNSYSQQPNTPGQSIQRNKIVQASQSWRLTSASQKALWLNEVVNYPYTNRVGDQVFYNAFQLFQYLNQNNFQNGFPVLLSPPAFQAVTNADWFITQDLIGNLVVTTTDGVVGTTVQVWVSPQVVGGVIPASSRYRFLTNITVLGGQQTSNIELAYEDMFGSITLGKFIFAKFKTIVSNNGHSAGFSDVSFKEIDP